jgi:hypothetical protein
MTKGRPFREWLDTPSPLRAVLIGKGPSLDSYADQDACGAFVMTINEAAEVVRCDAAVYIDDFKLTVPRSTIVFRPPEAVGSAVDRTYLYERSKRQPKAGREGYHLPHHGYGTSTAAITILGMWGIREVLMVGFDSLDGGGQTGKYAECLIGHSRPNSAQAYVGINKGNQAALLYYAMTAYWFHRGERWPE